MKAFEIAAPFGIDALRVIERPRPAPGSCEVLVKVHAVSLNYRDLEMVQGTYQGQPEHPFVVLSDGSGEVVEVGQAVTRFQVGDRVIGCFWQDWQAGALGDSHTALPLGGPLDGMASEYVVLPESGLVSCPVHLSWEEAATLPCAALTAWQALIGEGQLKAGEWVLVQGTGGVSLFALQFAVMHGARVIVTSSQASKLQRTAALGAEGVINYQETPDWHMRVLEITGGRGVDHILEVGGPGSFAQSLQCIRTGGQINVIGYLGGQQGDVNPLLILQRHARVRGIAVGPRAAFEAMNRAIEACGLHPQIDSSYHWFDLPQALRHLASGRHFGKLVLRLAGPA